MIELKSVILCIFITFKKIHYSFTLHLSIGRHLSSYYYLFIHLFIHSFPYLQPNTTLNYLS